MAAENNESAGVKVIIGPHEGTCGLPGVTVVGSKEVNGIEKVVVDREYFEKEKSRCKKLNGEKGGCNLCTADPTCPTSVADFCPFDK